jgi:transposase
MTEIPKPVERVIGLDVHPHSFTAAVIRGPTPAAALVEKVCNQVALGQLGRWAQKQTTAQDMIVLEASGNSFAVARSLLALERRVLVLESGQLGKLKEAHANNDKISAIRIAKAYLAGTAKEVWIPDPLTQERRDLFHTHRKAVKYATQARNSLLSYLSDHGVTLKKGTPLCPAPQAEEQLRRAGTWSARQWQVIEGLLLHLRQTDQQRAYWRSVIAQEVLADPQLLSLVRLCGIRDLIAFALGALVGDIHRFSHPKKLVKYVGLNPAFDESGQGQWHGGIGGHGRKDLRTLLIEAAQAILRSSHTPLARWGKRLLASKPGRLKLAVAAVARKLTVAIWYLMMGRWTPVEEIEPRLRLKIGRIITQVGVQRLKESAKPRQQWRQEAFEKLKATSVPRPDPGAPAAAPVPATA